MVLSNLAKVIIAGAVGAGIGSAVTYVCVSKHFAKKADDEIASIRALYYHEPEITPEPEEEKEQTIINENPDDYGSDICKNFKFGEKITDYTAYSKKSESTLSEEEHPTDDEGEDKVYTISSIEYDEDYVYEKRSVYYYIDDDLVLDEEDEPECIADDGRSLGDYRSLVINGFDVNKFKDTHADTVFVRNENVQIDFEIIRMQHYVH